MPKFPKGFGRRKSTANAFEDVENLSVAPAEHSFKVFERPDGGSKSFDGGVKLAQATPGGRPRTSPRLEENIFADIINTNRGSGASNTNTASTTDNSSRLSAASTAPSSTDISGKDEWRSPHDKPYHNIPVPPVPRSSSGFSLKNAGRSLSWGRNGKTTTPPPKELPPPPQPESPPGRARAVTASSYASTATPLKVEDRDLGLSLGGDFGEMFSGFDKRKNATLLEQQNKAMSQSPVHGEILILRGGTNEAQETLTSGPAARSYSSTRYNQPSPLDIDRTKQQVDASPYSWGSHHSKDRLMSNTSPPPFAPRGSPSPPPIPRHTSPNSTRPQRPGALADTGLRRSTGGPPRRQSTLDYDEDAKLLREAISAGRKMNEPSYSAQVRDSWALPSDKTPKLDNSTVPSWNGGSTEATLRAGKPVPKASEEGMFDSHFAASADLAQRFQEQPQSPPKSYSPQHKVMTPAQFERYKQDQERLRGFGSKAKDEDDDEEEEHYDDEEDEAEKHKQLAKQRRKQEAHMAVYRQQMMKVTGESAAGPSRPPVSSSQSTSNLANLGQPEEGEEEDEEVPLAILQAHGFPNKNKQPMRSMGSNPNLRAQSLAGGADGRLPVFARNLPQDPYLGAGLVNPAHRESLAFGGGAASVSGAPSRGLPPGGLVGVIATEERSRAMRRGSPNPQGEYGPVPPPSNGFNGMGMPPGMNPVGPMGMNPMMMTPGDQAQIQMSQQMQQFMQMQMQFMQMMTAGGQGPPPQGHMSQPSLGGMPVQSAPSLRPGSSHQRSMNMLDPNVAPWMLPPMAGSAYAGSVRNSGGGYAPSIAPSERSNVGLPGRYRPVSQMPVADKRPSTMSGGLQNWENKNGSSTIKPVKASGNVSDEDDEEGWEEMAKKREKKKSLWRNKKESNGFKDLLGFTTH